MKNERTSKRIASLAGRVLAMDAIEFLWWVRTNRRLWRDLRALAASALTQTTDKPKRKAKAR